MEQETKRRLDVIEEKLERVLERLDRLEAASERHGHNLETEARDIRRRVEDVAGDVRGLERGHGRLP